MAKFTCLILCVVAVSLGSVCAAEEKDANLEELQALVEECANLNGQTGILAELDQAVMKRDLSNVKPCFWGCAFKKTGFLNSQGQYDLGSGLTNLKKLLRDPVAYAEIEAAAKYCEIVKDKPVSDGEAGCQRGTLVADCLIEKIYYSF